MFLVYATAQGHTIVDRELYLPRDWIEDPACRAEAGVPEAVDFVTKPALAQQMLQRTSAAGTGDPGCLGDR